NHRRAGDRLGADSAHRGLARHPRTSARSPRPCKPGGCRPPPDAAHRRLLTPGAGVLAAGALWFTAPNFTPSPRTFELTEQGQVTDRYTKAIEPLGSDRLDVCIGGIYTLERIAYDPPRDHPTVMEVLAAFVRDIPASGGRRPSRAPSRRRGRRDTQ